MLIALFTSHAVETYDCRTNKNVLDNLYIIILQNKETITASARKKILANDAEGIKIKFKVDKNIFFEKSGK